MTHNSGNVHHTMTFRTTNMSHDHQCFHDRRSFQLVSSLNGNFSHEYHDNHLHKPNTILNHPKEHQLSESDI